MNYIRIAWRNLWRNKRRTVITSASIMFAVFFAVVMRSFQLGTYDHMIKNIIESFSGFIQVQQMDYQDDMTLENSFAYTPQMLSKLDHTKGIKSVAPRLQSFALASTGSQTKGALIMGIDPAREKGLSDPGKRLVHYRFTDASIQRMEKENVPQTILKKIKDQHDESYVNQDGMEVDLKLTKNEEAKWLPKIAKACAFPGTNLHSGGNGVLVSDRLSKFLKIGIGDTLILVGQGYHGVSAAGLYPVRGIVKIPAPDLDNKLIFMPLAKAQDFYSMYGRLTSIAINPYDNSAENIPIMRQKVASLLNNSSLVVKDWKQFDPVLKQQIEGDNQTGKVMLGLLYFIIFFGIFGTVLMMIHERSREFGVLIAIGMQRKRLAGILILEMLLMGLIAVIVGIGISLPILYIGHVHPLRITGEMAKVYTSMGFDPVMPMMWINTYVFWQGFIVALMVVLSCLYPLRKVFTMKEVDALRA